MKKKGTELSFFSVCLLLITLSLTGCKQANQGAEKKWGLAYDSLMMDRSVHLFGDTAKPSCHLVLNLTFVSQANDTKFKDSLNHYLLGFSLGDKFISKEPREALENFQKLVTGGTFPEQQTFANRTRVFFSHRDKLRK